MSDKIMLISIAMNLKVIWEMSVQRVRPSTNGPVASMTVIPMAPDLRSTDGDGQ